MRIEDVEIMAPGTWNGTSFSRDDLIAIAQSFHELDLSGKLPVKLGHDAADTEPAQGWIADVRVESDRLLATIDDVPQELVGEIKAGRWRFVSVELLRDVAKGDRKYPWVLDGLAILGAARPAVDILQGLHELVARALPGWRFGARVSFNRKVEGFWMNDVERLQTEMINLKFNYAIEAGRIEANQREAFFKRYGRAPVAEQVAEVDAWISTAPKPTRSMSRTHAARGHEQTFASDHRMVSLVHELQDEHFAKYNEKLSFMDAARMVIRDPANKTLVKVYFDRE